jgi:AcrR family transcriptional regulator
MVTVPEDPEGGPVPGAAVDGRSAIRDRNRDAVLDAVLDLFSEDNLSPGPEEVAGRAGLSVRSVYRYFDDHDALSRAAIERQLERVGPLLLLPAIGEGALDDRIARFVEARLRLQAAAGPALRATRIRATFDPVVRDQFEADRVRLREQIGRQFAPELSAMAPDRARSRLAAVDALSAFESVDHYLVHRAFDPAEAAALLADALRALLTD